MQSPRRGGPVKSQELRRYSALASDIRTSLPDGEERVGWPQWADGCYLADFRPRFGLALDLGYARDSNLFGTAAKPIFLTYLCGPVFYTTRSRNITTSVRALVAARVERANC
jgi:hypothetical protein